jgi:hypothetical protein
LHLVFEQLFIREKRMSTPWKNERETLNPSSS